MCKWQMAKNLFSLSLPPKALGWSHFLENTPLYPSFCRCHEKKVQFPIKIDLAGQGDFSSGFYFLSTVFE
jgi:hypothetical protein